MCFVNTEADFSPPAPSPEKTDSPGQTITRPELFFFYHPFLKG